MKDKQFKHYHPEIFDPVKNQWDNCPFPDIDLLQIQALGFLSDYDDIEIEQLILDIEEYEDEATSAMQDYDDSLVENNDLRWIIQTSWGDLCPKNNNKKHFHYMAVLTLIFLSQAAYNYSKNNFKSFVNSLSEAYRSFEYLYKFRFLEIELKEYQRENPKEFARLFSSIGGQKSTSPLTQDKPAVIAEWKKVKSKQLSRNKSADKIIDNLKLKHAHSTILRWIREHERVPVKV